MKKFISVLLLLLTFSLSSLTSRGQQNDFGLWNTLDIEGKLNQRFSILLTEEMRLKENLLRMNLFYTNIGVSYKLNKHFKVAPIYRFIQKYEDDGSVGFKHRLMLDLLYKKKFGMIGFTTRTRLQGEVAYINAHELGGVPEYYWRQKFDFKVDLNSSRFTPYFGSEIRIQFFTPFIDEFQGFGFSRTRVYAGCNYEINKMNAVGAYYLTQFDFQVNDPVTLYILGLEYSLTLDLSGGGGGNDEE